MRSSLFEQLTLWVRLFARRSDIEVQQSLTVVTAVELAEAREEEAGDESGSSAPKYPPDASAFAEQAVTFRFQFGFKDRPHLRSMLSLDLTGEEAETHLEFDEHAARVSALVGEAASLDEPKLYELDVDVTGIGLSGYFMFPEGGRPIVLWDVEELVLFTSLTDYLTAGARHGFVFGQKAWPVHRQSRWSEAGRDTAAELRQISLPTSTPIEALRTALVAQGATAEEVDDLLEWLGPDASLLVALPMEDARRFLPGWHAPLRALNPDDELPELTRRTESVVDADFSGRELPQSDFTKVDGPRARFVGAEVWSSDFSEGRFDGADFSNAKLSDSRFRGASLRGARFRGADLRNVDFGGADCTGADFSGARLSDASFAEARLDGVVVENAALQARASTLLARGMRADRASAFVEVLGSLRDEKLAHGVISALQRFADGEGVWDDELKVEQLDVLRAFDATLRSFVSTTPCREALERLIQTLAAAS